MTDETEINKSEQEWQAKLTPEQYSIMREKGTEAPFTGKYYASHEDGMYHCAACGNPLFSSDTKFDSGTGWPSFFAPLSEGNIKTEDDDSLGTRRTEVMCNKCGAHLGHVFNDGPGPTGQRYCINSVCLDLQENDKKQP